MDSEFYDMTPPDQLRYCSGQESCPFSISSMGMSCFPPGYLLPPSTAFVIEDFTGNRRRLPMPPFVRRLAISVVGLFGTVLLIGCNAPRVSVSVTPPSAQTILQHAQKAPFNDATFTLHVTGTTGSRPALAAGKPVLIPYVGTGTGKITMHPERYYEGMT